jgi:hypothetical protein
MIGKITAIKVMMPKVMLPQRPMNIKACALCDFESPIVAKSMIIKERQLKEPFIMTMIQLLNLSILFPTRIDKGITKMLLIIIMRLTASLASFYPSLVSG